MSAHLYSIETLLVGKYYRSNSTQGEIVSAEKDNRAVWYGEDTQSYLVRLNNGKWRTLAVSLA